MKRRSAESRLTNCLYACLLWAMLVLACPAIGDAPAHSLFSQSAAKLLGRDFPGTDTSYLLLDASTGETLAEHWQDSATPVAMGSLVKPFTAMAYAADHPEQFRHGQAAFPALYCSGRRTCWNPRGHGQLDIATAIAYSCNSYFEQLAQQVSFPAAQETMDRFQLAPVTNMSISSVLAGIDPAWGNAPAAMAHAYLALYRHKDDPEARPVIEGMRLSAQIGTGHLAGAVLRTPGALVKTGTGPCVHHHPHSTADGFAVILTPADAPRLLLLIRVHGKIGSEAARIGGEMLADIDRQNGPMR